MIADQMTGECVAIRKYEQALGSGVLDPGTQREIEEIVSDEKNHLEKLQAILKQLDSIEPARDVPCEQRKGEAQ